MIVNWPWLLIMVLVTSIVGIASLCFPVSFYLFIASLGKTPPNRPYSERGRKLVEFAKNDPDRFYEHFPEVVFQIRLGGVVASLIAVAGLFVIFYNIF